MENIRNERFDLIEKIEDYEKIIKDLQNSNNDKELQNQNLLLSEENIVFSSIINELKTEIVQLKAKFYESENKSYQQPQAKKSSASKQYDEKNNPYTHYQFASPVIYIFKHYLTKILGKNKIR